VPLSPFGSLAEHVKITVPGGCSMVSEMSVAVSTGLTPVQFEFTAARLASAAGPGEILVTSAAVRAAELDDEGLERRTLELKGKQEVVEVFSLTVGRAVPVG
jgi:hypothetical protein